MFILAKLSAAEVDTLDTAAVTLREEASGGDFVFIPTSLQIFKPAGVAYTLAAGTRIQVKDEDGLILFDMAAEGFLDSTSAVRRVMRPAAGAFNALSYGAYLSLSNTASGTTGPALYLRLDYEIVPALQVW
jgi:hypothetical protein